MTEIKTIEKILKENILNMIGDTIYIVQFKGKIKGFDSEIYYPITWESIYNSWDFKTKKVNIGNNRNKVWTSEKSKIKEFYKFLTEDIKDYIK